MAHLILEIAVWVLLAFFIGCLLGFFARSLTAENAIPAATETKPDDSEDPELLSDPAAGSVAGAAAAVRSEEMHASKAERPKGIAQARGGKADNLQRISGIGPKNERTLHSLGFFHFDQIAGWSDEEVAWVDDHLKFNGRIIREEWILQAGLLAEGKEDEFERLYGSGRRKHGAGGPN